MSVVVIKLGGSLLDLPDLGHRLASFLRRIETNSTGAKGGFHPLLIVGGGPMADVVRDWDHRHHLGDVAAHHLAMATLAVNELLIAELLPNSVRVKDRDEAERAWAAGRVPILKTEEFIAAEESIASIEPLPRDWSVTSDSLAAWVAATWPASWLVLLKSTDLPADLAMTEWADCHLVDGYFPQLMPLMPRIDWFNLRGDEFGSPTFAFERESPPLEYKSL